MDERLKELIERAAQSFYDSALADGAAQAQAQHAAEIAEIKTAHAAAVAELTKQVEQAKTTAYESGYKQGHADALHNLDIGGQTDEETTPAPVDVSLPEIEAKESDISVFVDADALSDADDLTGLKGLLI